MRFFSSQTKPTKKKNMRKMSGAEGCHRKNAVPRHGVFLMTGPRMLVFAHISFVFRDLYLWNEIFL
jgi:hypothetical protein